MGEVYQIPHFRAATRRVGMDPTGYPKPDGSGVTPLPKGFPVDTSRVRP